MVQAGLAQIDIDQQTAFVFREVGEAGIARQRAFPGPGEDAGQQDGLRRVVGHRQPYRGHGGAKGLGHRRARVGEKLERHVFAVINRQLIEGDQAEHRNAETLGHLVGVLDGVVKELEDKGGTDPAEQADQQAEGEVEGHPWFKRVEGRPGAVHHLDIGDQSTDGGLDLF